MMAEKEGLKSTTAAEPGRVRLRFAKLFGVNNGYVEQARALLRSDPKAAARVKAATQPAQRGFAPTLRQHLRSASPYQAALRRARPLQEGSASLMPDFVSSQKMVSAFRTESWARHCSVRELDPIRRIHFASRYRAPLLECNNHLGCNGLTCWHQCLYRRF